MKTLLLGKNGQVGWELRRTLAPLGEVIAVDYPEIDFCHPAPLVELIRKTRPQVIVNAVAYTAVDRAESERDIVTQVNGTTPGIIATAAKEVGAALIHYSTDYVFDGDKSGLYTEEDEPNPLNHYGVSKLEGERTVLAAGGAALVLRTSWVYSTRRDSFVTKVLGWSRAQKTLRMVSDQVGCPTWARMLAEITTQLIVKAGEEIYPWIGARQGVYNLGGAGYASRLEWAQAILANDSKKEEQVTQEILPALTAEFPTPARRPLSTPLDCDKFTRTFGLSLPDWKFALALAMETQA